MRLIQHQRVIPRALNVVCRASWPVVATKDRGLLGFLDPSFIIAAWGRRLPSTLPGLIGKPAEFLFADMGISAGRLQALKAGAKT